MPPRSQEVRFDGTHGTLTLLTLAPTVIVLEFSGSDVGEFGEAPFRELDQALGAIDKPLELFIDARRGRGVAVDVSGDWARWLGTNRHKLRQVSMLTGSRFIQLSAEFVRRFAGLEHLMRIYSDPAAFEGALAHAVANAG